MKRRASLLLQIFFVFAVALLLSPVDVEAYVGPGMGLSAIGTLLALLAALILAVIGFIWYPIKQLMRKLSARKSARQKSRSDS